METILLICAIVPFLKFIVALYQEKLPLAFAWLWAVTMQFLFSMALLIVENMR